MIGKLIMLFAVLVVAFARPQVYSGLGYGSYAGSYPGYYGYSGYASPYSYGTYGSYGALGGASPYSNFGYGYY